MEESAYQTNNLKPQPETQVTPSGMLPPLPNSTLALVLGILSIPLCCFIYGAAGLIAGTVGLILANKATNLFKQSPESYSLGSYNNAKAAKICAIIGIVFSLLIVACLLMAYQMFGTLDPQELQGILEEIQQGGGF